MHDHPYWTGCECAAGLQLLHRSSESVEELDRRDMYLQYRALERECVLALAAQPGSPEEAAAKRRCRQIVASWRSCMMSRQQQGAILNGAPRAWSYLTSMQPLPRVCGTHRLPSDLHVPRTWITFMRSKTVQLILCQPERRISTCILVQTMFGGL